MPSWPASGKPSWPGPTGKKPSPLVIPQTRRDPGRWPGPRTYQNPSPRTVAPLPAPSRPKTATLQPNSQAPQAAPAVKKNAPPKKTGFALDDEAEYGDYGGGPAFGHPDDSMPTDTDFDIPDDPGMDESKSPPDETSAENSDESEEQEPAKSDDATPGSADAPSSTSPTVPDPSGGAGAADPPS